MFSGGNLNLEKSPIATRKDEYSPNHNLFINAYFGKLFLGYLTRGAMNKTHVLFFRYSLWFCHKIHLNISVVILQQRGMNLQQLEQTYNNRK